VIDINSQFDQSFKVDSRPTSRNSFTLQQLKINSTRIPNPKRSREEIRFKNSSSNSPQENNIGLAGLKISTKPRCTPVSVLSSLKKDRINCTCSACEDRKEKVQNSSVNRKLQNPKSGHFDKNKRRINKTTFACSDNFQEMNFSHNLAFFKKQVTVNLIFATCRKYERDCLTPCL